MDIGNADLGSVIFVLVGVGYAIVIGVDATANGIEKGIADEVI